MNETLVRKFSFRCIAISQFFPEFDEKKCSRYLKKFEKTKFVTKKITLIVHMAV